MREYGESCSIIRTGAALVDNIAEHPAEPAFRIVSMLHHYLGDGYLKFARSGEERQHQTPNIVRCSPKDRAPGIFIPRDAITASLTRRGLSAPDPSRVTDAFEAANALDSECEYDGHRGWFIVESWWNTQIGRCNAHPQHRLKVIGGEE
jgi:hypothetical protein